MLEFYFKPIKPLKKLSLLLGAFCLMSLTFTFSQISNKFEDKGTLNENELLAFIKENNEDQFNSKEDYIGFITHNTDRLKGSKTNVYAEICFLFAKKLSEENKLYQAYEYLDRASTILTQKDITKVDFAAEFFNEKGTYFYKFRRYDESKELLFKALKLLDDRSSLKITVLNTLGLVQNRLNNIDSSLYYYNKGLEIASELGNNDWVGVINGNLGYNYYLQNDLEQASKYLTIDKELSLKNYQRESAINAISTLIAIQLKDGDYESVEGNMILLDSLIPQITNYSTKNQYYFTKTIYWKHLKEYEKAYNSYHQSVLYKDSSSREYDQTNLQNMIFQIKFQKKKNESDLILEKEKRTGQLFYGIATILSIITLACILIIYLMRKRKISEHKILELEKEKIQTELKQHETELNRILKYLVEKNEIIESLNQELKTAEENNEDLSLIKEKNIIYEKLNSFTLLTESDLLEFKRLFDKIHPGFYNSLTEKYDDLTKSEVRLGMLIRLNLTSLEMSLILGISQDSVRKSNLRLRKKLQIVSQKELVQFIKMI